MGHHAIVIACRDNNDGNRIRATLGEASIPVFSKSSPILAQAEAVPGAYIVATPLMLDENCIDLLTKLAVLQPMYSVIYANQCSDALNILRMYGSGASVVLGCDELDQLAAYMDPPQAVVDRLVMPPFFIDDDVSNLKEPPINSAQMLHVTFLGSQAMMSFSNAVLNIEASSLMSFACKAPPNAWAQQRLQKTLAECTGWGYQPRPTITCGAATVCKSTAELSTLEPTGQHFVVCHGYTGDEERAFIKRLPKTTRIFVASNQGYVEQTSENATAIVDPERLWDIFISSLYNA